MIIELVFIAGSAFVIGLSGAMSPGPVLTVTIAESVKRGPWAGPLMMVGHAVLELVLVGAIVLGLDAFLQVKLVQVILFLIGSLMLCVMAYLTLKSSRQDFTAALKNTSTASVQGHALRLPVLGVLISLSNPFWTLWWVTIGMTYLGVAIRYSWWGIGAFFIGHILSDFGWYSLISFSIGKGRKFISNKVYRIVLTACAIGLLIFAGWFIKRSVELITV